MDNQLNFQTGKELLKTAIERWAQDGLLDSFDGGGSLFGKGAEKMDEDAIRHNLEKDPVINLFMTALAHQTNLLKEQISNTQTALLNEFVRKTLPYELTRPTPSVSVLHVKMADSAEPSCLVDDSTFIQLENRSKTKMRFKELEKFSFLPLLKTKILNASVSSVKRIDGNTFELTLSGNSIINNLSGMSLFFPHHTPVSLSLTLNGKTLPVVSINDCENLPLCDIFNVNHCVFNRALLYGATEHWIDKTSFLANKIFYIGDYEGDNNTSALTLQMTIRQKENFSLTEQDVLINCFPIVNVEKGSVYLSAEEPIKRIATEKQTEGHGKKDAPNVLSTKKEKVFLHLLASSEQTYQSEQISLRRFGAERYHVGEVVAQTNALIHRYSSDFHAFSAFADIDFDDKMNQLRILLNEIGHIVNDNRHASSGVYVMLQKHTPDFIGKSSPSIAVSYLLTDGVRGNGITTDCTVKLPPILDEKESAILMTTSGGSDEITDEETLRTIAAYYNLSKDRLITKSDIKQFCYKELAYTYHIPKTEVRNISFQSIIQNAQQEMIVIISLVQGQDQEFDNELAERISIDLQQKINARTTGFCQYSVQTNW